MASYAELLAAFENPDLRKKVRVAVVIASETVRNEGAITNHANRMIWAKDALMNPEKYVDPMFRLILAQNKAATQASILAASDATVQTGVDAVVDIFATGAS